MNRSCLILLVAFGLDLIIGDPRWLYHPVRGIGTLIAKVEPPLRGRFPSTKRGEQLAGLGLVLVVTVLPTALTWALLWLLNQLVGATIALIAEILLCTALLATRSLYDESMAVYKSLQVGDLAGGRRAVSMIVGRDTAELDEAGVSRATVETVAENFSDGVLAPMVFLLLGGAPGMMFYKAVNTMDSMVGYQNQRYRHFGTAAAKLDDLLNFLPARMAGLGLALLSPLVGLNGKHAVQIFFRDRKQHKSPNSAHTEAAVAGALGVQLGGDSHYGGQLVKKPTIGDNLRPISPSDIKKTNQLMLVTALISVAVTLLIFHLL